MDMSTEAIQTPAFDLDGFMPETEDWSEETARRIATMDGLGELNERQIALLHNLRECYQRIGAPPALYHVCHLCGFDPHCMTQLFPTAREAWRVAGLPNPGEEAKSYL